MRKGMPILVLLAPAIASPAAASSLKVAGNQACLAERSGDGDLESLIALGVVDQARGALAEAEAKYTRATGTGYDVLATPIDVTYAKEIIWVQANRCAVPVPRAPDATTIEVSKLAKRLVPEYPRVLLSIRSDGTVHATVWVGEDGKASRIHVNQSQVGPPEVSKRLDPGEEIAERMVARVQLALQAIEQLRAHEFGPELAGKVFEWELVYLPPKDASEHLPGAHPRGR